MPVCLKKKHNARKAVWFTKATVHWSNFCIFVDSIDSQIILRMIRESKRASLIAEEKYRLKKMELNLNKEKKALQLRTEIAKVEAKERAFIGFTHPNQIKEERRTGFVTPPGTTRPNLQMWSECARSSLCRVILFQVVCKCQEIDIL